MRRMPIFLGVLLLLAMSSGQAAMVLAGEQAAKLRVMATLFPYYDWAGIVGGEQVEATLLLPPGVEAHSFDPTAKDIARLKKSDIFIYTGTSMEPWAEDLAASAQATGLLVVEAGRLVGLAEEDDHAAPTAHGHDKHDHHGHVDPHIWLDFPNAEKIVEGIARALAEKDPAHGALYLARAKDYGASLRQLDQRYGEALASCRHRTIVYGGHFAFGYVAQRYRLEHVSPYKGFSPNAEPSPKDIATLARRMKQEGHSHIFFEEGIEPKVAKVISGETGAGMLLLHGAHNIGKKELEDKVSYLSLMNDNLKRLQEGLQCQ